MGCRDYFRLGESDLRRIHVSLYLGGRQGLMSLNVSGIQVKEIINAEALGCREAVKSGKDAVVVGDSS